MPSTLSDKTGYQSVQRVINVVRERRLVSRRDIANATGLSTPSITRLTNDLVDADILRVTERQLEENPGPGRPAGLVALNPMCGLVLGIDIGEHVIQAALGDMAGRILVTCHTPSSAREGGQLTFQSLVSVVEDTLSLYRNQLGTKSLPLLRAITVGVPGTVDRASNLVLDAPNIRGWQRYPLKQLLVEQYPTAFVRVENDVNIAAVGESAYGVAKLASEFVFVSFRQEIGAGIFVGGKLYRGSMGFAGEVGFMAFSADFSFKKANGLGHLETLASEQPLLACALTKGFRLSEDQARSFTLRDLCLAVKAGDEIAVEVLEQALRNYGVAVANIASLLNPQLVVIGGDLAVIAPLAVERIKETVARLAPNVPEIRASDLGENAALQGAFYQAHVDACATLTLTDGQV